MNPPFVEFLSVEEEFEYLDKRWKDKYGYTYSEWCEYSNLKIVVEPYITMRQKLKRYKQLKEKIENDT